MRRFCFASGALVFAWMALHSAGMPHVELKNLGALDENPIQNLPLLFGVTAFLCGEMAVISDIAFSGLVELAKLQAGDK